MSERAIDIERIIRSCCSVYIRSKEGRTIDTGALDEIKVDGIELAAKEIAALAAAERVAGFTEADEKNLRSHLATLAMAAVSGKKGDLAEATGEVIDFVRALAAERVAGEDRLTADAIAKIIRSFCFGVIQSREGQTLDTESIGRLYVGGIELAAEAIAALARSPGKVSEDSSLKPIYIKAWRSIIFAPAAIAKEIQDALRVSPGKVEGWLSADDIKHFVSRVHEIDRRAAEAHFIRTGQSMTGTPDETVVRVLAWLASLPSPPISSRAEDS